MPRPFYSKSNPTDGLQRLRFTGGLGKMSDLDTSKTTCKKNYEGMKEVLLHSLWPLCGAVLKTAFNHILQMFNERFITKEKYWHNSKNDFEKEQVEAFL